MEMIDEVRSREIGGEWECLFFSLKFTVTEFSLEVQLLAALQRSRYSTRRKSLIM